MLSLGKVAYGLDHLYRDVTVLISTLLLMYFLHVLQFFNILIWKFAVWLLKSITCLPVTIASVELDFYESKLIIYDLKINAPPLEIDPRWKSDLIIGVKKLTIKYKLYYTLLGLVMSNMNLYYVDCIIVESLNVVLEGNEDPETGEINLNISLIGVNDDVPNVVDEKRESPVAPINSHVSTVPATGDVLKDTGKVVKADKGLLYKAFRSVKKFVKKNINAVTDSVTNAVDEVHDEGWGAYLLKTSDCIVTNIKVVAEEGILTSASKALGGVLNTAKHTIDALVEDSIKKSVAELHELMLGPEPDPTEFDVKVLGRVLLMTDINVKIRQALPTPLQYLERKPLKVARIVMPLHKPDEKKIIDHSNDPDYGTHGSYDHTHFGDTDEELLFDQTWKVITPVGDYDESILDQSYQVPFRSDGGIYSGALLYRFERVLFVELFKGNGGRLLYELIKMGDWKHRSDLKPGADFIEESPLFFEL